MRSGFDVKYYRYPLSSRIGYNDPNFFLSTYTQQGGLITTKTGVTDINFSFVAGQNIPIYGTTIANSNFTLELTGYYYAPLTGLYTFTLQGDDGASMQVGAGTDCCGSVLDSVTGQFSIKSVFQAGVNPTTTVQQLTAGTYYPIKIVYFQIVGMGRLNLNVIQPDGTSLSTFNTVKQIVIDPSSCQATTTITKTWTGTATTTKTNPIVPGNSVTIEVDIPIPTTTVTSTWTGVGSTISTVSATPGQTGTVINYLPIPTTTLTSTWTGVGSTISTVSATPGQTGTVINYIPVPTSTVTSTWTGSGTTTRTVTATPGQTGTVEIDIPVPTSTITSTWTGVGSSTNTIPATPGQTGTVINYIPVPTSTFTKT